MLLTGSLNINPINDTKRMAFFILFLKVSHIPISNLWHILSLKICDVLVTLMSCDKKNQTVVLLYN